LPPSRILKLPWEIDKPVDFPSLVAKLFAYRYFTPLEKMFLLTFRPWGRFIANSFFHLSNKYPSAFLQNTCQIDEFIFFYNQQVKLNEMST
jgi:hypothetical protein